VKSGGKNKKKKPQMQDTVESFDVVLQV